MNLPESFPEGQSRDPSRGTRARSAIAAASQPAAGAVLIVEDREDDALLLKRELRKAGVTMPIKIVQDGEVALDYLQGAPPFSDRERYPLPTIITLDLYLPNKSGFEVLKWLRARAQFKDVFVAVLTGSGKVRDITRAYRLGANSFLSKPCRAEDIRNLAQGFPSHWRISPPDAAKQAR